MRSLNRLKHWSLKPDTRGSTPLASTISLNNYTVILNSHTGMYALNISVGTKFSKKCSKCENRFLCFAGEPLIPSKIVIKNNNNDVSNTWYDLELSFNSVLCTPYLAYWHDLHGTKLYQTTPTQNHIYAKLRCFVPIVTGTFINKDGTFYEL